MEGNHGRINNRTKLYKRNPSDPPGTPGALPGSAGKVPATPAHFSGFRDLARFTYHGVTVGIIVYRDPGYDRDP